MQNSRLLRALTHWSFSDEFPPSVPPSLRPSRSLHGIKGISDASIAALAARCSSSLHTLDVNGCIGIKVRWGAGTKEVLHAYLMMGGRKEEGGFCYMCCATQMVMEPKRCIGCSLLLLLLSPTLTPQGGR